MTKTFSYYVLSRGDMVWQQSINYIYKSASGVKGIHVIMVTFSYEKHSKHRPDSMLVVAATRFHTIYSCCRLFIADMLRIFRNC